MTDQPNVGAVEGSGAADSPSQTVSSSTTKPIEGDAHQLLTVMESKFEALTRELRGLQSRQDKSETNFQQQLARFNQVKAKGNLSDEEAMSVLQQQDAEQNRWQTLEAKLDQLAARLESSGIQEKRQQTVAEVFASKGVDVKDPRVAPYLVKEYKSDAERELAAYRLRDELASSPSPTQAQSASTTGTPQAPANVDALFERYTALSKNYTVNRAEIEQIEKELKAAGAMR